MAVLTLPDLGEGLQRADIVSWHVAVGDHVVTNQPLLSVETDKAVVEVPSPVSGTITRLHAEVGESVEVGALLVEFDDSQRGDTGTVVGELKSPDVAPVQLVSRGEFKAMPAVRALAEKLGVDLLTVEGSGPGGAILRGDIELAAGQQDSSQQMEPMRGVRRAMAERMAIAHTQVVPATLYADADIEQWPADSEPLLRLVQAVAAASNAEPALNVWLDTNTMHRQLHQNVDLGIAVDTADGLFVPTLRDVGERSADDLRDGIARLKRDVRDRSIPPDALRDQTITLSNFGSICGRYAQLVVVPPQVAIVGAGRIHQAVVAVDNKMEIHRQLPLSLSFDHRAVTGAEAARFMAAMIAELEKSEKNGEPDCD
jgi:2-oxoisovalerate dehydrogenase E2 component (dihydrolipoyl transacylase)